MVINYGLELRKKLGDDYRIALSLNSLAIAYLQFGRPYSASKQAKKALDIFRKLKAPRGIGLSCITLGRALRQLGSLTSLSQAEMYLRVAANLFKESVNEPIRLIETYNELGQTYSDQTAKIYRRTLDRPFARLICNGARYLREATQLSEGKNIGWYIKTCQDLGLMYSQIGQSDEADYWLQKAEQAIPGSGTVLMDRPAESKTTTVISSFETKLGSSGLTHVILNEA